MITKPAVIVLVFCAIFAGFANAQDWQSADMVDEIQHTEDSIWIHDSSSSQAASVQTETQSQNGASFIESSQSVDGALDMAAMKQLVRDSLEAELKDEIVARVAKAQSETNLVNKIAERVATWSPNFRFQATDEAEANNTITLAPPSPCANVQCLNGGSCSDGKCTCTTGFSGARCETSNKCEPENCLNGGKCMNNVCTCAPGWSGPICAIPSSDRCAGVVCQNGGECQKETGACICFGNFKGQRCEIVPPPGQECLNIDCKNGAACKNGFCQCGPGFSGKFCEVNACLNITCLNGGRCDAGKCVCADGWTGKRCTIDPCKKVTCMNKGTCAAGKCKCTPEWEGAKCEISMLTPAPLNVRPTMVPAWDACTCGTSAAVNCSTLVNNTCPGTNTTATVTRVNETISLANVSPLYPCHTVPCQNGGECKLGKCECHGGFSGLLCEVNGCSNIVCQNGGICKNGACRCNAQFKGLYCEKDACEGVECLNGGVCKFGQCDCLPDFRGKFCGSRSAVGLRRDRISNKIAKLTERLTKVNDLVPLMRNITSDDFIKNNTAAATETAVNTNLKKLDKIHDTMSNLKHQPPHQKKDKEGKLRWHQQTPPAVIKKRVDAVPLPPAETNKLETGFHRLHNASTLSNEAEEFHKALPGIMKEIAPNLAESEAETEEAEELEDMEE